jgi:alcohol dehydrogenase class IV
MGTEDVAGALFDLAGAVGAERSLHRLGMPENGIETATERAFANPYWNPRPLERNAVRSLIARAYAGERPASN